MPAKVLESIFLASASVSNRTQSSACPGQERPHLAAPCAAFSFPQDGTCGFVRRAPLLPGCSLQMASNQQSKSLCRIPQPEKTMRLGPSGYQFPPLCPSPTSPRNPLDSGKANRKPQRRPKIRFWPSQPVSGALSATLGTARLCAYIAVP